MTQKKILIVDDNAVVVKAMTSKLGASGYEVLSADDGASAVGVARQQKPDLIILDISFPPDVAHGGAVGWDGFAIMSWLRRIEEARHIPIFVMTGEESAEYKNRALAAGAARFFRKPMNPDELLDAINQALAVPSVAAPVPA